MEIAKVFQTGRSQAVRLPKAFRFNGTEVAIKSFGRGVLLMPIDNPWDVMSQDRCSDVPELVPQHGREVHDLAWLRFSLFF